MQRASVQASATQIIAQALLECEHADSLEACVSTMTPGSCHGLNSIKASLGLLSDAAW